MTLGADDGRSRIRLTSRSIVFLVVLALMVVAKVLTSLLAPGSRGDTSLTIVIAVLVGGAFVVGGTIVHVRSTTMSRTRILVTRFGEQSVFTAYNVIGLRQALRSIDPDGRVAFRPFYSLVVEAAGVGIWQGTRSPTKVVWIPGSSIESVRAIERRDIADRNLLALRVKGAPGVTVEVPIDLVVVRRSGTTGALQPMAATFEARCRALASHMPKPSAGENSGVAV